MTIDYIFVIVGVRMSTRQLYAFMMEYAPDFRAHIEEHLPREPLRIAKTCEYVYPKDYKKSTTTEPTKTIYKGDVCGLPITKKHSYHIYTGVSCKSHSRFMLSSTVQTFSTEAYIAFLWSGQIVGSEHEFEDKDEDENDELSTLPSLGSTNQQVVDRPTAAKEIELEETPKTAFAREMQEVFDDSEYALNDREFPRTNLTIKHIPHDQENSDCYIVGIVIASIRVGTRTREKRVPDGSLAQGIPLDKIASTYQEVNNELTKARSFGVERYLPPVLAQIIIDYCMPEMSKIGLYNISNDCGCCS